MSVTVTHIGRVDIDLEAIVKLLESRVPGAILKRVNAGLDTSDRPFKGYSGSYMHALVAGGESTAIDLRLTGGLLNSVKLRETRRTADGIDLVFAPDAGTSPAVSLADGKAKKTGKRGPPHNVAGYWIHNGTPKMPARPWLGLSPRDAASLKKALEASKLTRSQ